MSSSEGNTIGTVQGDTAVGVAAGAQANPEAKPEKPKEQPWYKRAWGAASPWAHGVLDAAGFIPGLGAFPDLANAGIYGLEGNGEEAMWSLAAAIPGPGDVAKGGRMAVKGGRKILGKVEKEGVQKVEKEVLQEGLQKAEKQAEKKSGGQIRKQTREQLEKSKKSYEDLLKEHEQKLADYKADPWKYDNKGALKNAPSDQIRQNIIDGRIKQLESQMNKHKGELEKIDEALDAL